MKAIQNSAIELSTQLTNYGARGALSWLNHRAPYRFAALSLLDKGKLRTVYLLDRDNPDNKPSACESTGVAYCNLVLQTDQLIEIADALDDERVINHPNRHEIRAYCGAPLRREDGSVCGTVCLFDDQPRQITEPERVLLSEASRLLGSTLNQISAL